MKSLLILILSAFACSAQVRYQTLYIHLNGNGTTDGGASRLDIATNEIVEVVSIVGAVASETGQKWADIRVIKDSFAYFVCHVDFSDYQNAVAPVAPTGSATKPIIFAGPIAIIIEGYAGMVTCKITRTVPESYPVGKTALVPPGAGSIVSMESSPDLLNWSAATNGLYSSLDSPLFFRINMQKSLEQTQAAR